MIDKVYVTNGSALATKYGPTGVKKIKATLKGSIAADKRAGLSSTVVNLDSKSEMKKHGGEAVSSPYDPKENKLAIDAVYHALEPDYLVILGSIDVVPHQDLKNPVFQAGRDDDAEALGDLPYSCDATYSREISKFMGSTRVVGRIPDLVGATDPEYLINLLKLASAATSHPLDQYLKYFGLSALVWRKSTELSLTEVFGNHSSLVLSPPVGSRNGKNPIGNLAHFINCHGAPSSPNFYGQKGDDYPLALSTKLIENKITPGTVAAAECCYGAQLYDSVTLALDMPICQSYLLQGAYGFFGSSTIAYGPAETNGAADLLCQYFLQNIMQGASLGRAVLMARQKYVSVVGQMDPIDLKTLAQFSLLGDPSIQPIAAPTTLPETSVTLSTENSRFARSERRANLKSTGDFLGKTKPFASKKVRQPDLTPTVVKALSNIAKVAGFSTTASFDAFSVQRGGPGAIANVKVASTPVRYHVATDLAPSANQPEFKLTAVVAKELDGRIVDYRIYKRR